MRSLVVGYGSIGARHARLLAGLGLDVAVVSRREIEDFRRFATLAAGLDDWRPDYVVIASRTAEHRSDLACLADSGFTGRVLVEKPLFADPADLPVHRFAEARVAYNLRFHPAAIELRRLAASRRVFAAHAYVGQHLADWRPGTDYRRSYSASRAEGGGVLRDLSHELDLIGWMFGKVARLTAAGGHLSDLDTDAEDAVGLLMETTACPLAVVQMNCLETKPRREITLQTDAGTLRADLVAATLDMPGGTRTFATERDGTYLAQHKAMLDWRADACCSLDEGLAVVALAAAAERAIATHSWVSP